jgi:hypothetical protein
VARGSAHLVLGDDMPAGEHIDMHRHPGSAEILFAGNGQTK